MNFQRIWAISLTRIYPIRSPAHLFRMLMGPVVLTILFGFIAAGFSQETASNAPLILMATTVIWQLVMYPHQEITLTALSDLTSSHFMQLFSTPLTKPELAAALLLPTAFTTIFVFLICAFGIILIHGYNPFFAGLPLLPLLANLFIFGEAFGLLSATILIRFGEQLKHLALMLDWFIVVLSGVYYPYDKMAGWLQALGKMFPLGYIFGFVRGEPWVFDFSYMQIVIITFLLSVSYLLLVFFLFDRAIERVRKHGSSL